MMKNRRSVYFHKPFREKATFKTPSKVTYVDFESFKGVTQKLGPPLPFVF